MSLWVTLRSPVANLRERFFSNKANKNKIGLFEYLTKIIDQSTSSFIKI